MSQKRRKTGKNVISVQLNASFYYQKAVHALERHNYDKALKYFRRATDLEPQNPVNHCNVAGILSEIGQYEASNRSLQHVLEEVDPYFYDCYFYMANNYANMEEFEFAEEYVIRYLEREPEGIYSQEAYELLEYLSLELERPPRQALPKQEFRKLEYHESARKLLEKGKFLEASRLLKKTIEEYPEFLAARNNLSLTYYYMGRFEKAMEEVKKVLEVDENNLHALCNLAVYYNHIGNKEKTETILAGLKKVYPMHDEQTYKLATTMGILGEHSTAQRHFLTLYHSFGYPDPSLIHQIAVSYYNQGLWKEAERWWNKLKANESESSIGEQFIRLLNDPENLGVPLGYQYPGEQVEMDQEKGRNRLEEVSNDPFVRSSFFWALHHGDAKIKHQVITAMGTIADEEVREILKQLLLDPKEEDQLKKHALSVLQKMDTPLPLEAIISGKRLKLYHYPPIHDFNKMVSAYLKVVSNLQEVWVEDDQIFLLEAEKCLSQLFHTYPELWQRARKWESIAALIEYLVLSDVRQVNKSELVVRYGITLSTLNKYIHDFPLTYFSS